MEKTSVTADDLRKMSERDFLNHLKKFPYKSNYDNLEAADFALTHLSRINGNRYFHSGSKTAFTISKR